IRQALEAEGFVYAPERPGYFLYKEDITTVTLQDQPFEKLLDLRVTCYREATTGQYTYGIIAEEADALGLTGLVVYDSRGYPSNIRDDRLMLYLLQLAKIQNARIDELESRIAAL